MPPLLTFNWFLIFPKDCRFRSLCMFTFRLRDHFWVLNFILLLGADFFLDFFHFRSTLYIEVAFWMMNMDDITIDRKFCSIMVGFRKTMGCRGWLSEMPPRPFWHAPCAQLWAIIMFEQTKAMINDEFHVWLLKPDFNSNRMANDGLQRLLYLAPLVNIFGS